jgi:hypothetical protein
MKRRSPAAVLLLPIATLGLYCLYWLYRTRKEVVARNGDPNSIPPVFVLFAPCILFLALIFFGFAFAWADGSNQAFSFVVGMLTVLVGLGAMVAMPLWWFWRFCSAITELAKGMDLAQLYVLYIVISWVVGLPMVWMLIAQIELNKYLESTANAGQAGAGTPPSHEAPAHANAHHPSHHGHHPRHEPPHNPVQ